MEFANQQIEMHAIFLRELQAVRTCNHILDQLNYRRQETEIHMKYSNIRAKNVGERLGGAGGSNPNLN